MGMVRAFQSVLSNYLSKIRSNRLSVAKIRRTQLGRWFAMAEVSRYVTGQFY
jgi:hypothetical protein